MIKRHYFIHISRYNAEGAFQGTSWNIRTVKSWRSHPVGVITAYLDEVLEEFPGHQIVVNQMHRI